MNFRARSALLTSFAGVLMLSACVSARGSHELATFGRAPAVEPGEMESLASAPPGSAQHTRYLILQAEQLLADSKAIEALQMLPGSGQVRDPALALRCERDRAQALFAIGDPVGATQILVRSERLATDPDSRSASFDLLWNGLHSAALDSATGPRLARADAQTRGWVELAQISRSVWPNAQNLQARLAQWRSDFPQHPAGERIASIAFPQVLPRKNLQALALLLPLSGGFAATGEAVRDGFLSAYFQSGDKPLTVRIYDTGATPDTLQAAYRSALSNGAEFLVGPLRREDVGALAEAGRPPVPVLALNYLDPGRQAPFNFFQWGLAPEDEARQAAERAVTDHQYRAAVLVPEGDWGARILRAFRERLEALGGTVIAERNYPGDAQDHSETIRSLLSLDMSEERHRAITMTLGTKTKFEPRRRQDVDLIFIAARPDQAKLLGAQLRFHRTGELPVYATSLVYDGEAPAMDLNGLRFCDMPWMLEQDGHWSTLRAQLSALFPARGPEYSRLLALGHDAYTLMTLIESGQLQPGSFFPAASGTLALRADGVISRGLTCVEIDKGKLKPLELAGPAHP